MVDREAFPKRAAAILRSYEDAVIRLHQADARMLAAQGEVDTARAAQLNAGMSFRSAWKDLEKLHEEFGKGAQS